MSNVLPTAQVSLLHQQAMDLCDRALEARASGQKERAIELFRESFEAENRAALLVSDQLDLEPTRSILLRSAATLALDCSEFRAAERLIATALAGDPPDEIAEELRDLLEQAHFSRHLELRGLRLASNEFQIAISGKKVGYGIVLSEEFVDRVQATEKLILRTFDRLAGQPFHEEGPAIREASGDSLIYLAAPRAGSFAATIRVGMPSIQAILPGFDLTNIPTPEKVINEFINILDAFRTDDIRGLEVLIPDRTYRRNFSALADQLLPDGKNVTQVGFTVDREGSQRTVALVRPQSERRREDQAGKNGHLYVEGRLFFADATSARANQIKVIDDEHKIHAFVVPEGMMFDIVKALWDDRVAVYGIRSKRSNKILVERITKAPKMVT